MCGATGAQKASQANEVKVSDLLRTDMQLVFGKNQGLLDTLTKSLSPTVQSGPNQYGFSPTEDAARRTQATEQFAAAGANATNSVRNSVAAQGGMNLPSGSEAAIESSLAQNEANQQANAQLNVTEQGYEAGRQNYFQSVSDLASAPGQLENPATQAGSAAMGAAGQQMQGATDIANAQNAWMAPVAGMIGAVGGAALGKPPAPCWVAAEVFGGWYEPRTILVREYLTTIFTKSLFGHVVMALYTRFGPTWATWVRKSKLARGIATSLMSRALRNARKKHA